MVPGITERERRIADTLREDWLAEARRPHPLPANTEPALSRPAMGLSFPGGLRPWISVLAFRRGRRSGLGLRRPLRATGS